MFEDFFPEHFKINVLEIPLFLVRLLENASPFFSIPRYYE